MTVFKWANGKGQTLILSPTEAIELQRVLQIALGGNVCGDSNLFYVELKKEGG